MAPPGRLCGAGSTSGPAAAVPGRWEASATPPAARSAAATSAGGPPDPSGAAAAEARQSPTDPGRTGTIGVEAFDAAYGTGFQVSDDSPHARPDGDVSIGFGGKLGSDQVTTGRAAIFTGGRPVRLPDHCDGWHWEPYAVDGTDIEAARQTRRTRWPRARALGRRNAEIMVVQEVPRWRREVERFTPERLEEFEAGIHHALEHPAPLQRPEGR